MRKKNVLLCTVVVAILGLTGCQSAKNIELDYNNQTIIVPKTPNSVVVMNYGALDTLNALGKSNIVSGTSQSSIPAYLNKYNNTAVIDTGDFKEPRLNIIKARQPQLIIIERRQMEQYDNLVKIAPVINLDIDPQDYFNSAKKNIMLLGKITNSEKLAERYIKSLEVKITATQLLAQTSNKQALLAIHNDGKVILTNSGLRATLIHDVLGVKRAVPSVSNQSVMIDNKYIANNKPNIIFIVDRNRAIGNTPIKQNYFDSRVLAKANTKVIYLTADVWYLSGGGIESMNIQIDEIANALK